MNKRISPGLCSLHYSSVEKAVRQALALGEHTQLAKFDLDSVYRVVPVLPTDRLLLEMPWKGESYVETALPFGFFKRFLILGSGGSNECGALQTCSYLGVSIARKKMESPAAKLVFLGIEINVVEGVMKLVTFSTHVVF